MVNKVCFLVLIFTVQIFSFGHANNFLVTTYCHEFGEESGVITARPVGCLDGSKVICEDSSISIEHYENEDCTGDLSVEILESNCLDGGIEYVCASELPSGYCYFHYYDVDDENCEGELMKEIEGFSPTKCVEYEGNHYKLLANSEYYAIKNFKTDSTCKISPMKGKKLNDCIVNHDSTMRIKTICDIPEVTYSSEFYHDPIYSPSNSSQIVAISYVKDGTEKRCTTDNVEIIVNGDDIIMKHCNDEVDNCYECSRKPEMINPVTIKFSLDGDDCENPISTSLTEAKMCMPHPTDIFKYSTIEATEKNFKFRVFNDTSCQTEDSILIGNYDTCIDFFDSPLFDIYVEYSFNTVPSEETPSESGSYYITAYYTLISILIVFVTF